MLPKSPPTYRVEPDRVKAETVPLALGSKLVASPVAVSIAAIQVLICPPMLVKSPPTYRVEPDRTKARTTLLAFGLKLVAFQLEVSIAAI